jgi:hypothetical protein
MVGDSYTYGQGVLGARYRFSNLVEKRLIELGGNVVVLNFALGNGAPKSETEWIRKNVISVKPDVVMIFYVPNDIDALDIAKVSYPTFSTFATTAMVFSPTFNFIFWRLIAPSYYEEAGNAYFFNLLMAYHDTNRMNEHLTDVREMVRSVHEIGAKPVLVIVPFPRMWQRINPEWQKKIYDQIGSVAKSEGSDVIELQRLETEFPPQEFEISRLDGHPNERVHARIADELIAWLKQREHYWRN